MFCPRVFSSGISAESVPYFCALFCPRGCLICNVISAESCSPFLCVIFPWGFLLSVIIICLCYNYLPISAYCSAPGFTSLCLSLLSAPSLFPIYVYCSAAGVFFPVVSAESVPYLCVSFCPKGFLLCYIDLPCLLPISVYCPAVGGSPLCYLRRVLLPVYVYCSAPGGFFSIISAESAPCFCVLFCPRVFHLSVIIICRVCSLFPCIVLNQGFLLSVISAESAPYICALFCPRSCLISVISAESCSAPGVSPLCYNYLPLL